MNEKKEQKIMYDLGKKKNHRSTLAEVQREVEMRLSLQNLISPSRLHKAQMCFLLRSLTNSSLSFREVFSTSTCFLEPV